MAHITNLTQIGNSLGIIINKKLLQEAGVSASKKVSIEVKDGTIIITPVKKNIVVNLNRSTWEAQFKKAIKAGNKPEKSVWPNNVSEDADKDWNW